MGRLAKFLGLLIIIAILAWFASQNSHRVPIYVFRGRPLPILGYETGQDGARHARPVPVYLLIVSCLFLGALIAGLILIGPQLRLIRENRELRRKITEQRAELDVLRKMPIGEAQQDEQQESSPGE